MRFLAKFLAFIAIVALLATGYVIWAADVGVASQGYVVESAADRAETFENIKNAIRGGTDGITVYGDGTIGNAEDYIFVTYTLQLRNRDVVPFEWVEMTVKNLPGDVLMIKPLIQSVPAFNETAISFTLMMDRGAVTYARDVVIGYYVYGHYKELTVTLS